MPEAAGVGAAFGLAVLSDVRYKKQFRIVGRQRFLDEYLLQLAEAARKADLLRFGEVLILDGDDATFVDETANLFEFALCQRLQRDAADTGTNRSRTMLNH